MKNTFNLTTSHIFEASAENVWHETINVTNYPNWWTAIKSVKLHGNADVLHQGAEVDYCIQGFLPHKLHFNTKITKFVPLSRIEMDAYGDLSGHGVSTITNKNGYTHATFEWNVSLTPKTLNILSGFSLFHKLFVMNHNHTMKKAISVLKKRIEND